MNYTWLCVALLAIGFEGCKSGHQEDAHSDHEKEINSVQYTIYNNNFEVFVDAEPFIAGRSSHLLSHFTHIPSFKPIAVSKITAKLVINGAEFEQTLQESIRQGIFQFTLKPTKAGKGTLSYRMEWKDSTTLITIPEIAVYASEEEVHAAMANHSSEETNITNFTKEQSWKIDFATQTPVMKPFGSVIRSVGVIQSDQSHEMVVTSKATGFADMSHGSLLEGQPVNQNETLLSLRSNGLAENNISVWVTEAENNFTMAKGEYERAVALAQDSIISQKDLMATKTTFENARVKYENLIATFNGSGEQIKSPRSGYIKEVYVKNGSYVEAGQPLLLVADNNSLLIKAEVPHKYEPVLNRISNANIRVMNSGSTYTLEELEGKVLTYGRSATHDNFSVPIYFQIRNNGNFTPGTTVEVFLKVLSPDPVLTIPNSALLEEQGLFFVFVQHTPERFEKRVVSIGATDGVSTEITRGITPSVRIITRGALMVKLSQSASVLDPHAGHVH